jgi:integrase
MGLYRRGRIWWMSYTAEGKQRCESTRTTNKRVAQRILDSRKGEIIDGRFHLTVPNAPRFEAFARGFLECVRHPNTKKRYTSSVGNLIAFFGDISLPAITSDGVERFKAARLRAKVRAATVNRDLAVLRRMLKIAAKRRQLPANAFFDVEMLEERKERRQPHILTFQEEKKLLMAAPDHIRLLVILILETGLRSRREALALKWKDVNFSDATIQVVESKSLAGRRSVPMSRRCKDVLLAWQKRLGPQFSEYVFANPLRPQNHLVDVRVAWVKALKTAGLDYFWIYDLRHTFASRLTEAGVSPIFVAQIMGHSNPNILQTYAKAIDEFRRSAISKLEALRVAKSIASATHDGQAFGTIQ